MSDIPRFAQATSSSSSKAPGASDTEDCNRVRPATPRKNSVRSNTSRPSTPERRPTTPSRRPSALPIPSRRNTHTRTSSNSSLKNIITPPNILAPIAGSPATATHFTATAERASSPDSILDKSEPHIEPEEMSNTTTVVQTDNDKSTLSQGQTETAQISTKTEDSAVNPEQKAKPSDLGEQAEVKKVEPNQDVPSKDPNLESKPQELAQPKPATEKVEKPKGDLGPDPTLEPEEDEVKSSSQASQPAGNGTVKPPRSNEGDKKSEQATLVPVPPADQPKPDSGKSEPLKPPENTQAPTQSPNLNDSTSTQQQPRKNRKPGTDIISGNETSTPTPAPGDISTPGKPALDVSVPSVPALPGLITLVDPATADKLNDPKTDGGRINAVWNKWFNALAGPSAYVEPAAHRYNINDELVPDIVIYTPTLGKDNKWSVVYESRPGVEGVPPVPSQAKWDDFRKYMWNVCEQNKQAPDWAVLAIGRYARIFKKGVDVTTQKEGFMEQMFQTPAFAMLPAIPGYGPDPNLDPQQLTYVNLDIADGAAPYTPLLNKILPSLFSPKVGI
ncbi:hypothetical protein FRC07_008097 [Ceratobasidium sp. 392]|nr:hypothetical protein FRC07_008097 [Ceratobasidium sp. 392]